MSIETARSFFLWCSVINIAILLVWAALATLGRDCDTDREIRARFDRQASATKQRPLLWSLPILMLKTVFFFVSFH